MLEIASFVQSHYVRLLDALGLSYREVNGFVHSVWAATSLGVCFVCVAFYFRYRNDFDDRLRLFFSWLAVAYFLEGLMTFSLVIYIAASYQDGAIYASPTSAYYPLAAGLTLAISVALLMGIRTHIVGTYGRLVLAGAVGMVLLAGMTAVLVLP